MEDTFKLEMSDGLNLQYGGSPDKRRKRKIDREGFVCPATPDIPRSSRHFKKDSDVEESSDQYEGIHGDESGSDLKCELPSGDGAACQETITHNIQSSNMSALFSDLHRQFEKTITSWQKLFTQSESFERQCPEKLDTMIQRARDLDDSLQSQKALLCRRLHGIGQILQH
ncbi:uncharacterized protein LOC127856437 [Dreissena polymorpha]|uniref:Uncharacterized protein n=1 Tax=Dreissena polymorpha TaxID=45954 RepID=A0A9D4HGU8_DREPO|nr:uncharacterized protein LOC127856437 [Dreissena polymorpha]XP_052248606.1 uncharacterized protein LOC127856437 [Dreissena polymorpha]KAH3716944.1 hypothetical protein DPMN_059678 [Dreissena polymorpha]